jgi:hypothetical protein
MIQSYASVAKLRSGGPFLCYGVISHGAHWVTATSNRHRRPVTSVRVGPKLLVPLRPPVIVRDAERSLPAPRRSARATTGQSKACAPRPRSWFASAPSALVRARKHLTKALSFWNMRNLGTFLGPRNEGREGRGNASKRNNRDSSGTFRSSRRIIRRTIPPCPRHAPTINLEHDAKGACLLV